MLLGEIITAMKEEFDKLKDSRLIKSDCDEHLQELKAKIERQQLTDRTAIRDAIQEIQNNLQGYDAEQAKVLGKVSEKIDNLVKDKISFGNNRDSIDEIRALRQKAAKQKEMINQSTEKVTGATAEGVKSTKKSRKQKPAKKPRKKSGHRRSKGKKGSRVSGRRMIKLTRRKGRTVSTA